MKLKHGKKYETVDGVVYRVKTLDPPIDDLKFESSYCCYNDFGEAIGIDHRHNLIRRYYTKPKPAHKLDLKPGDVVKLVAWEDDIGGGLGETYKCNKDGPYSEYWEFNGYPKGQRPLFKVVSRA